MEHVGALARPEVFEAPPKPHLRLVEETPLVIAVPETAEDRWSRQRAERIFRQAGSIVTENTVTVEPVEKAARPVTLLDAIRGAGEDPEKHQMVQSNVRTEAIEIAYKAGFTFEVDLSVTEEGRVLQFGQTAEDFNINSLRHASDHSIIRPRTNAETRNSMRIEDLHRRGSLDDYYFVVFSRCAEAPDEVLQKFGFFAETKSMAIQATTANGKGGLTLESAFVAGLTGDDAERHDQAVVERFGERHGVDLSGQTDAETIDTPLLIHKSLMPNGVIDVVKELDQDVADITGKTVFYGQQQPILDYTAHREQCRERAAALDGRVAKATDKLIAEAPRLRDPVHATERLHKLVEAEMVEEAAADKRIDARVFGQAAAFHIESARLSYRQGDYRAAYQTLNVAKQLARSSSCPMALRKLLENGNQTTSTNESGDEMGGQQDCKEIKNGERVKCPSCKQLVKAIVPSKEEIYCSNSKCSLAHASVKEK